MFLCASSIVIGVGKYRNNYFIGIDQLRSSSFLTLCICIVAVGEFARMKVAKYFVFMRLVSNLLMHIVMDCACLSEITLSLDKVSEFFFPLRSK